MARVIYSDNPYKPREGARMFTTDGPFIDFLESRFPDGFAHPYVVYRRSGTEKVDLEGFDFTPEPNETVVVLEYPGGTFETFLVQAAVNFLVSFAITLITYLLFPPPKNNSRGGPSPVYSFQARQNQARLGEPIPTIYGRMITYPNIVSQPYYRYIDNDQYLYMILGIGHGWHKLNRVLIENDEATSLPAGTITTWLFNPDRHKRKIGEIEAITGVWEDVITSPVVAGQRLVASRADGTPTVGWYNTNPAETDAVTIEFDLLFPQGIAQINNDGSLRGWGVNVVSELQQIDDNGDPVGGIITQTDSIEGRTRTPQRRTISRAVTGGRWRIRFRRSGYREGVLEETQVVGLRARLNRKGQTAYGDTSLLVVRVKANEAISDDAQRRIRADVSRLCTTWRQPGLIETSNPADHVYDVMTDPVNGAGRPKSELDIPTLQSMWTQWQSRTGFNGQFDQRSTIIEALRDLTAVVRGRPITIGGELSLISDGPQPLRSALFTPDNIKKDTLSIRYAFRQQEPFDGYEVEFFEAKDFTQESRIWPKSSVRPRTVPLLGCTSAAQAEGYARFLWQQDTYLRKLVTFETELEGLIYALGDRIGISHPLPNWGQSARVERVSGRVLTLDQVLPTVTTPFVFLRDQRGGISAPLACTLSKTPEGDSTIVTLTASAPFSLFGRGDQEPTLVALGSGQDFLQDFTITEIQPTQQGAVRIGGILYDERVWQGVGI